MMQYTAAVIGVGAAERNDAKGGGHQIGYRHAETYARSPHTKLIAAADIRAENLEVFARKFEVAHRFADHRQMLKQVRPQIVSICTYVTLHRQMIEDCARAGVRGIFCEKPFLATPAEIESVEKIAAHTGVKIIVAHFRRYLPAFIRLRELYAGGAVGQPMLCSAGLAGWDLSEWGSHWLDMFRHVHDDRAVEWVFGQARVRDLRGYGHAMEDHAAAYFQFAGGGKAMLDGGCAMNGPWTMTLAGTEGCLRLRDENTVVIDEPRGRKIEDFSHANDPAAAWNHSVAELIRWIEGGPPPLIGLPNALRSAELNLACYVSAIRGDRVDLPLRAADLHDIDRWPVELLAQRNLRGKGTTNA